MPAARRAAGSVVRVGRFIIPDWIPVSIISAATAGFGCACYWNQEFVANARAASPVLGLGTFGWPIIVALAVSAPLLFVACAGACLKLRRAPSMALLHAATWMLFAVERVAQSAASGERGHVARFGFWLFLSLSATGWVALIVARLWRSTCTSARAEQG